LPAAITLKGARNRAGNTTGRETPINFLNVLAIYPESTIENVKANAKTRAQPSYLNDEHTGSISLL
jgi:hypothetical protein